MDIEVEVELHPHRTSEGMNVAKVSHEEDEEIQECLAETFPSLLHAIRLCVKESDVKCIDVGHLSLQTAHMKAVFNILPNTQVSELKADYNNLEWGVQEFSKQLIQSNVSHLSFKSCTLQTSDLFALMEALPNSKVTDLDLSYLSIREPFPQSSTRTFLLNLAKSHLIQLKLTASPILCRASGKDLASRLPNTCIKHLWLEHINFNNNEETLENLFLCLPKTVITELHLGHNEIGDSNLKSLCNSLEQSKLEVLDLQSNKVTDAGVNMLSKAWKGSRLRQLILTNNKISGANTLGENLKKSIITVLHLGGNIITNEQMFSFPNFLKDTCITELYLDHCSLGDQVVRQLMECLSLSQIRTINLSGNHLSSVIALKFATFAEKSNISKIDLSENNFSAKALEVLGKGLKESKVSHLALRGGLNKQDGFSTTGFVNEMIESSLQSLDISNNNLEYGLMMLSNFFVKSFITHLNLSFCQIGARIGDLVSLLKYSSITNLNLSGNKIDDLGAEKLTESLRQTKVFDLNVSSNFITDKGAEALGLCLKSGPLYFLNLVSNKISEEGIIELAEMMEGTYIIDLKVSSEHGYRQSPLAAVMWRNRLLLSKLISFFSTITSIDGNKFCFNAPKDRTEFLQFTEKCLLFYKEIIEEPSAISALANEKSLFSTREEVVEILEGFPSQFVMFIISRTGISQRVSVMERAKARRLSKIVNHFLVHFASYLVKEGVKKLSMKEFEALQWHQESIASKSKDREEILRLLSERRL